MLRSRRAIAGLCLLSLLMIGIGVGIVTGFFAQLGSLWNDFLVWISSPLTMQHFFAGLGSLAVLGGLMVLLLMIIDD